MAHVGASVDWDGQRPVIIRQGERRPVYKGRTIYCSLSSDSVRAWLWVQCQEHGLRISRSDLKVLLEVLEREDRPAFRYVVGVGVVRCQ
jgi:hypothetical protein